MLGWWCQPASFSFPAIKLNPPWSPHQRWWLLLASEKRWWHERREGIEKGVGAQDNGCLFISHAEWQSSNKEQSVVAIHPWNSLLERDNHWWGLLLQSIKCDTKVSSEYQQLWKISACVFTGERFSWTIQILLRQFIDNLTVVFKMSQIITDNLPNQNAFVYIFTYHVNLTGSSRRRPPAAVVSYCTQGPSCLDLYRWSVEMSAFQQSPQENTTY